MNDCAGILTEVLEQKVGTQFDIYGYFQGLTLDVISRCALALQLDCQRKPDVIQSNWKLLLMNQWIVELISIQFRTLFCLLSANCSRWNWAALWSCSSVSPECATSSAGYLDSHHRANSSVSSSPIWRRSLKTDVVTKRSVPATNTPRFPSFLIIQYYDIIQYFSSWITVPYLDQLYQPNLSISVA